MKREPGESDLFLEALRDNLPSAQDDQRVRRGLMEKGVAGMTLASLNSVGLETAHAASSGAAAGVGTVSSGAAAGVGTASGGAAGVSGLSSVGATTLLSGAGVAKVFLTTVLVATGAAATWTVAQLRGDSGLEGAAPVARHDQSLGEQREESNGEGTVREELRDEESHQKEWKREHSQQQEWNLGELDLEESDREELGSPLRRPGDRRLGSSPPAATRSPSAVRSNSLRDVSRDGVDRRSDRDLPSDQVVRQKKAWPAMPAQLESTSASEQERPAELSREVTLLRQAVESMRSGDLAEAERALTLHEQRYPQGALTIERQKIEARLARARAEKP